MIDEFIRLDHLAGGQAEASDYHADSIIYQNSVWDNTQAAFQYYGAGLIALSGDQQTMKFTTRNDGDAAEIYSGSSATWATFVTTIPTVENLTPRQPKPDTKPDLTPIGPSGISVDSRKNNDSAKMTQLVQPRLQSQPAIRQGTIATSVIPQAVNYATMPQMGDEQERGLRVWGLVLVGAAGVAGLLGLGKRRRFLD